MADKIRRIVEKDFEEVSILYNSKKSVDELIWLFTNPDNSKIYNGFVSIDGEDKIVGVIGFVLSTYIYNHEEIKGVIPMSWKISKNYKGLAGVLLFKKVLAEADLGIAIEGSKTAQNLYPIFKYKHISNADLYYKILNLTNFYKSLNKKSFLRKLKMISSLFSTYYKNPMKKWNYSDLEFKPYNGSNFVEELYYNDILKKKITENYINWLLACPILKSYAFSIKKGNKYYGMCVLYVQKSNSNIKGRIVHLPFLGEDVKLWTSVIDKCLDVLRKEGCYSVSALAHNYLTHDGFVNSGFKKNSKHKKPIFIKDSFEKVTLINLKNWNLQYSEGDKAYRDI